MKRYVVTGHPLGFEFAEIQDKNVGTEFEMDMDPGVERALLDTRAILILDDGTEPDKATVEEAKEPEPEAPAESEEPEAPVEPEKPAEPAAKRKAPDDPRKPTSADRK